ncbi:MAG: sulfatase-like hydrolase/transferase [Candidatus Glassbacteria bacterium]|nr:sulfatase-like hydrolase/transferase [Candidatus Glassbacteria bacterium]
MTSEHSNNSLSSKSRFLLGCLAFWAMETALAGSPAAELRWWQFRLYALAWYSTWGLLMDQLSVAATRLIGFVEHRSFGTFQAVFYGFANALLVFGGLLLARQAPLWPVLPALATEVIIVLILRRPIINAKFRLQAVPAIICFNILLLAVFAEQRAGTAALLAPTWWLKILIATLASLAAFKLLCLAFRRLAAGIAPRTGAAVGVSLALLLWLAIASENFLYRFNSFYPRISCRAAAAANPGADAAGHPNIVFILVDCLRADRLGCYGYTPGTTPNIDSFARNAAVFTRAYANTPLTRASVATMFTGLYPFEHGVLTGRDFFILPDSLTTLAETMSMGGYHTAAMIAGNPNVSAWSNFDQGFEEFIYFDSWLLNKPYLVFALQQRPNYMDGQRLTDEVVEWLDRRGFQQPFMLYLHYMDTHKHYHPPPWHPVIESSSYADGTTPVELYDNQVRLVDYEFGRVIEALKNNGLYDNTVVILTADHGESLGEHGRHGHGSSLYQQQIHVPLIVRLPGEEGGKVCDGLIGLIDIPELVLAALRYKPPGFCSTLLSRAGDEHLFTVLHGEDRLTTAVLQGDWKLLHREAGENTWELYNLATDPQESTNLYFQEKVLGDMLRKALLSFEEETGAVAGKSVSRQSGVSPEELERLKALGYIK